MHPGASSASPPSARAPCPGRHHRLEQRQRQRDAGAAEKRPPREVLLRDERHGSVLLVSLHLERRALDDAGDERREAVVAAAPRRERWPGRPACRSTRRAGPGRRLAAFPAVVATSASRRSSSAWRRLAGPSSAVPSASRPVALTGTRRRSRATCRSGRSVSSEKPTGSITAWHDAQLGLARCCSSRWRTRRRRRAVAGRLGQVRLDARAAAAAPARRAGSPESTCRA